MWPRILLELLPHLTRLVPAADKFFASRSANEKAQQEALAALAEHVRGGISGVTEEQAGLRCLLQEQSEQTAQLGVEVTRARMGVESVEARVTVLEKRSQTAMRLLVAAVVLLGIITVLAVVILVKGH
jgi:hypothetical protein